MNSDIDPCDLRAGRRLAQPSGAFVVTNAWDAAGRWWVVGGTAGTFTYAYPAGSAGTLPITLTLPGGGYVTNTYDALARLTRTELRTSAGAILNAHGYQYNLANQRTLLGRTNSAYPTWNGYWLAGYDPAGQLTNAWAYQPDGTPVTSQKWSYGYDAAQNLVKRTNNTTVETFTVNALNQLTSIPDSTPTYDRRGNLVSRWFPNGPQYYWSYSYDAENQLTSVQTDTYYTYATYRFKVEFTYDGAGRLRIKRDYTWNSTYNQWSLSAETRYLYDGLLIVQERNGSNTPTVTYTRGRDLSGTLAGAGGIGGLLARSHGYSSGNWAYHNFYHADGNGNVTALVNSGGALQASYKYDPYGRHLAGGGSLASANVLRFSSKPWMAFAGSTTSGLYYYGYRFYDPYLQRWVNRDPIGEEGSLNLYSFNRNDSLNETDSHGLRELPKNPFPVPKPKLPTPPPAPNLPTRPVPGPVLLAGGVVLVCGVAATGACFWLGPDPTGVQYPQFGPKNRPPCKVTTPQAGFEGCRRVALSIDESGELYCTFDCTVSGLVSAKGSLCMNEYFIRTVPPPTPLPPGRE